MMKLGKIIDVGIPILGGVLLVLIVVCSFLPVILREFFKFGFVWFDDLSQYCMVWMIYVGSIWVTKNNQHLCIGVKLHRNLNKRLVCLIDGILALLIVISVTSIAYNSAIFFLSRLGLESMTIPCIKMGYVYIALPLAMLALGYYYLQSFIKNVLHIFKKD
jgi:TRAP-type C4-dicarboxylate transport system permease small subunit